MHCLHLEESDLHNIENKPTSPNARHGFGRVNLPIEVLETIIAASDISTLKSWSLVCKILLLSARYHLYSQTVLCLRSRSHATDFIQWISSTGITPVPTCFIRRLRLCGTSGEGECWFSDFLGKLDRKLEGVHSLTLDFAAVPVHKPIFAQLTGLYQDARRNFIPLPNLHHLEMLGANTTTVHRVLDVVTLFPHLETLKMKKFRWNIVDKVHWIPFPAHLRYFEADVEDVLNPAVFMFALFKGEPRMANSFTLRVSHDYDSSLEQFDDEDSRAQQRDYFPRILETLDRIMPDVQSLDLEVPMDDIKAGSGTKTFLSEHCLLQHLGNLSVNGAFIIESTQ